MSNENAWTNETGNTCKDHPNYELVKNEYDFYECSACLFDRNPEFRKKSKTKKHGIPSEEFNRLFQGVLDIVKQVANGKLNPEMGRSGDPMVDRAMDGIFDVLEMHGIAEVAEEPNDPEFVVRETPDGVEYSTVGEMTGRTNKHWFKKTPSEFVAQYFEMDPATDDLLFGGTLLTNGMEVLIEDDSKRGDILSHGSNANDATLRKYNRWAVVSEYQRFSTTIAFIGIFEDGSKKKFSENITDAWYVKK